jgi:hypothetical protein
MRSSLISPEVGEEIGVLGGDLVEERLLSLQLLAERSAGVAIHDSLPVARGRRDATHRRSPWRGSFPDPGNSKWGAGNLQTGAPSGPFVSGRTHKSRSLNTASSRSACHPITTG